MLVLVSFRSAAANSSERRGQAAGSERTIPEREKERAARRTRSGSACAHVPLVVLLFGSQPTPKPKARGAAAGSRRSG